MSKAKPRPIEPMPDWWPRHMLNEREAAPLLGVEVYTLQKWRHTRLRDLPFTKLGSAVRYEPSQVWAWVCKNMVRPAAEASR